MKLYVVRHGQTVSNKNNIISGVQDVMLTEEGIKEAYEVKEKLKNINFDLVFSSPLKRAVDTAKIITNKEPIICNNLIERDLGWFEGKKKNDRLNKWYWNKDSSLEKYDIESIDSVYKRVISFIEDLKIKYPDKTVLIVTHNGIMRIIHYYYKEPTEKDLSKLYIKNCEIHKYEWRKV